MNTVPFPALSKKPKTSEHRPFFETFSPAAQTALIRARLNRSLRKKGPRACKSAVKDLLAELEEPIIAATPEEAVGNADAIHMLKARCARCRQCALGRDLP